MSDVPSDLHAPWIIDEGRMWPPRGRPRRPFGPTMLEVLRSCPLRGCFERSAGYERRMSFDGRIGTAFHRTLQSLIEMPPRSVGSIATEVQYRFGAELRAQEEQAAQRPRERHLPRNRARAGRALEALVSLAQRFGAKGAVEASPPMIGTVPAAAFKGVPTVANTAATVELEVSVQSVDGLLTGRLDRAERTPGGTVLIDYKSALRDDLPERYARQVQLYAFLWRQTRGAWPVAAEVVYPLTGAIHRVPIDPETCSRVGAEAAALAARVERERPSFDLATPGDVCQVCEFRPWCRPFWAAQESEMPASALLERAYWGFEGTIADLTWAEDHVRLQIAWRGGALVELVTSAARFPQLDAAKEGDHVRVLDARLHGVRHRPRVRVTEWTELYLVRPQKG